MKTKTTKDKGVVVEEIGGKPIDYWVRLITAHAKKERKKQESDLLRPMPIRLLERERIVRQFLEYSALPISYKVLEERIGVSSCLYRWIRDYKKDSYDTPWSVKLFVNVFLQARNEIKLNAATNIFEAVKRGDLQLSEKVMVATNDEYNPKHRIEKKETKDINVNVRNLTMEEIDKQLEYKQKELEQLTKQTQLIQMEETKDADGNVIYTPK